MVHLPGDLETRLDREIAEDEENEFALQVDEARKSGRYPLPVAAVLIARAAGLGVSADKMRKRLIRAAKNSSLPVYQLGQTVQWDRDMPFVSLLEIYGQDLNAWLHANEPKIESPFPAPAPVPTPEATRPVIFSPELRQEIASRTHWSERELEALCLGVPPPIYTDVSAPDDEREAIRKAICAACNNGKLHAQLTGSGNAVYGGQWRIERVSAVRWAVGFPKFPDWLARHDLKEIWARQDAERRANGRHNLKEAADMIAEGAEERADGMLKKLMQAVRDGTLPVYEPGKLARYKSDTVRDYYEEAYWNDLNAWLVTHESRIAYHFQNPNPAPIAPTLATKAQADEVIGWYDATLGAATWWSLNSITPREAAMLLCQFNPRDDTADPLTTTNNETGPDDFKRLVRIFEDVAQANAQARTLSQWHSIVRDKGLKYHSWIEKYESARKLANGDGAQSALEPQHDAGQQSAQQLSDEPRLQKGKNARKAIKAWIEWQARNIVKNGDTGTKLAERIELLAEKWGYQSERVALKAASIIRMIPAGLTGGRAKNTGRTKK
jgi:hypothetical protein